MKLEHFELRGFAQHESLDISFHDSQLNLILGSNEAGKSHLMTALTGTLFGIPDPDRYVPWHDEPVMTGRLTFECDGDRVEIERRFLEQQVDVSINGEQVYSGRGLVARNTHEDERYQTLLHQWIGFTEHDVFKRTVFVGQDQVLDDRLGDFAAQFKRLISGTREANYETAIQDLEAELDTLIKLPGKRANRRREDLQEKLQDLETRCHEAEQVQRQVVKLIEEERVLREKVRETSEAHERYQRLVERYAELQQNITRENQGRIVWYDLQDQINRLKRVMAQRQEQEQKRDRLYIPDDPDPGEVNTVARDIERLESRIEYLEEAVERNRELRENREFLESELERLTLPGNVDPAEVREVGFQLQQNEQVVDERQRAVEDAIRESAVRRQQPSTLQSALVGIAVLTLIGSVALGWLVDPQFFAGIALAVAFVISGSIAGRFARNKPSPNDPHVRLIQQRRQELQEAVDSLKHYQSRRNKLLSASGFKTLHDLFDRAREYHGTEMRLEALPEVDEKPETDLPVAQADLVALKARRDELLRVSGEPDLEAVHRRASEYRETVRILEQMETVDPEHLQSLAERLDRAQQDTVVARRAKQLILREFPELADIEAEQISEYRQAIERTGRELKESEQRLYQLQLDREHLGRGTEDAEELRLQVNDIRQEIERIELQADAHQLAIQTLQETAHEFQEAALDPVAAQSGVHMASLTDGRYQQVTLDRGTMTPTVAGNGQTSISLDRLSRGTRDQLYLSIRAALIDALSGDRNLPMLLDDPCVNFDEDRLANAAHLIEQLARERQILLFTKDDDWTRWFEPVLRLERRNNAHGDT